MLAWECATVGAEPHHQRNLAQIQEAMGAEVQWVTVSWEERNHCRTEAYRVPLPVQLFCERLFLKLENYPISSYDLIMSCLSEAHRRPLFTAPIDSSACILYK